MTDLLEVKRVFNFFDHEIEVVQFISERIRSFEVEEDGGEAEAGVEVEPALQVVEEMGEDEESEADIEGVAASVRVVAGRRDFFSRVGSVAPRARISEVSHS